MRRADSTQLVPDPVITNPELYRVIFENARARVLEYRDAPGDRTAPHRHPDCLMHTLSSFRRRLTADGRIAEVRLGAGEVRWLPAQEHSGENIGDTGTHVLFVELKEPGVSLVDTAGTALGPELSPLPATVPDRTEPDPPTRYVTLGEKALLHPAATTTALYLQLRWLT